MASNSVPKRAIKDLLKPISSNRPGAPLVDFHAFPDMPPELQDKVWKWCCFLDPAVVEIQITHNEAKLISVTRPGIPAILHATSGSRGAALMSFEAVDAKAFDREAPPAQPLTLQQKYGLAHPGAPIPNHILAPFPPVAAAQQSPATSLPLPNALMLAIAPPTFWAPPPQAPDASNGSMPPIHPQYMEAHQMNLETVNEGAALPAPAVAPAQFVSPKVARGLRPFRVFYVNPEGDSFKLALGGEEHEYGYPCFNIPLRNFAVLRPLVTFTWAARATRYLAYQRLWFRYKPSPFPSAGKLPTIFAQIQHMVLTLSLPPIEEVHGTDVFKSKVAAEVVKYCNIVVKPTLKHLPQLKSIGFVLNGGRKQSNLKTTECILKDFTKVPIEESNGVHFGSAELVEVQYALAEWFFERHVNEHCTKKRIIPRVLAWAPDFCARLTCKDEGS